LSGRGSRYQLESKDSTEGILADTANETEVHSVCRSGHLSLARSLCTRLDPRRQRSCFRDSVNWVLGPTRRQPVSWALERPSDCAGHRGSLLVLDPICWAYRIDVTRTRAGATLQARRSLPASLSAGNQKNFHASRFELARTASWHAEKGAGGVRKDGDIGRTPPLPHYTTERPSAINGLGLSPPYGPSIAAYEPIFCLCFSLVSSRR
jgi:hypothetical protein